jgi:phage terminase large subunit-like protein
MELPRYEIESSVSSKYFEFVSSGINGNIVKVVKYVPFPNQEGLYNLGFGDKNIETGELDDLVISNNGDTDKLLATVAMTVYEFFEEHPYATVYMKGSTKSRTRLYQISISKFIEQISIEFDVYGELEAEFGRFNKNISYKGFLIQKREK